MEADLREALDLWNKGQKPQACLMLKKSRGLPLPEAKALLERTSSEESAKDPGFTAQESSSLDSAVEQMSSWDDLVLDVLQSIKTTGALDEPSPKTTDWREATLMCEAIHQSIIGLMKQGVNPSRVMAAYSQNVFPTLLDKASGTEIVVRDLDQVSALLKASVPRHSLHADLISLL